MQIATSTHPSCIVITDEAICYGHITLLDLYAPSNIISTSPRNLKSNEVCGSTRHILHINDPTTILAVQNAAVVVYGTNDCSS